ncbi:MAG: hypothetical protein MJ252_00765 [archaeon]|nr:hypothetical protein [archaeon]
MSTRIIAILLLLLASTCDLKKDKLRRIQEADPGDDGSVTSFQSLVSHDELVEYEELLDTKLAFQKSIDFLPDAFEPDQQSYW